MTRALSRGLAVMFKYLRFLILLALGLFLAVGFYSEEKNLYSFSGFTMGTTFAIQFVTVSSSLDVLAIEEQTAELLQELYREVFSTYSSSSELTALNQNPVDVPFNSSHDLIEVLKLSEEIRQITDGAFDITISPLVNLWGFGSESDELIDRIPSSADIADAKSKMGAENIIIYEDRSEIVKTKDVQIDLSGIAKGYSVDKIAMLLDSFGLDSYFIEVGGEIKLKGFKPGYEEWVPAIETPSEGQLAIYQLLSSQGKGFSLAGSGDYRNYFKIDGVRYSHEIDPRTGNPVSHDLAAAFVISKSAAEADALATAFMVLGLEESKPIIQNADLPVFLISRFDENQFENFVSPAFSPYLSN